MGIPVIAQEIYFLIMLALTIVNVLILGTFALLRTYYNRKSVNIQGTMLEESRIYWNSWKDRSKDIAHRVEKDVREKILKEIELILREDEEKKKEVKK